jgi:beta-lactamase regulating signal transducer with metallopeptidase domain
MNVHFEVGPAASVLSRVAAPAIRSLLVAGAVGVTLAALRVSGARVKFTVWRAVLCVALAMPLLSLIVPPVAVPVSFLDRAPVLRSVLRPVVVALADSSAQHNAAANLSVSAVGFTGNLAGGAAKLTAVDATGSTVTLIHSRSASTRSPIRETHFPSGKSAALLTEHQSFLHRWRERIRAQITFTRTMALVYLAGFVVLAARMITGIALGARLARHAKTIRHPRAVEHLQDCARAMELHPAPRLAESAALRVPVTFGVTKPAVLLPVEWTEWSDTQLDSVLMHELSHVARRDALTERLSMLHRALFWFSPLSWWLDRELARLAEQASDEAALASGIAREQYAETLLGFLSALHAAPGRVRWQGISMAASGQAEKRVERILRWKGETQMKVRKPIIAAIVCAAVPVVCLASAFSPSFDQYFLYQDVAPVAPAQPASAPKPAAAPAAKASPFQAPAASQAAAPSPAAQPAPVVNVLAPIPPPPAAMAAPRVERDRLQHVQTDDVRVETYAPDAPQFRADTVVRVAPYAPYPPPVARVNTHVDAYAPVDVKVRVRQDAQVRADGNNALVIRDLDGIDEYVIVSGKFSYSVISQDGDNIRVTSDSEAAAPLRAKYGDNFIWFKRDGKEYVIRDQVQIAKVKALFDREAQLGKQQAELGEQEGKLGEEQGQLGSLMGTYNINVPDMSEEMAKLSAEMKALESDPSWKIDSEKMQKEIDEAVGKMNVDSPEFKQQMEQFEKQMKEFQNSNVQESMSKLQAELSQLNAKMAEGDAQNGERSEKLGELEAKLGEKQAALGEKQGQLGQQQAEISRQIDEMMKSLLDNAVASGKAEVK